MRVQVPAYTDAWMKGDMYGEVVKVTKSKKRITLPSACDVREIAHVKMDKSGRTLRFLLDDCKEV